MTASLSDVLRVQLLQWTLSDIISHLLTFTVIFLSVVLLHDAVVRSKRLNTSWMSLILSPLGRDHLPSLPGPWWNLPLLGYLPWLGPKPYVTMWNLSRRYGNVYQIRFGSRTVVVLNGRETIISALVQQGDLFAGRPDFPSFVAFSQGLSLAFRSPDADWAIQRKVALRVLGMFTCNTTYPIQALIHRHAAVLADRLLRDSKPVGDERARAVDPWTAIESAVVSIVFEVCFGEVGDGDEKLYSEMMRMLHEMRDVMPAVQSADIMPWLNVCLRRPVRRFTDSTQRIHQLATDKIDAMLGAEIPDTPACIVHALHHACLTKAVNDSLRAKLMAIVQDFIGAGSETVVQFIHWVILYAAKYPSIVQERVRDEIRRTVGRTPAPLAVDRRRMPYTEACMWEIMRHSCATPLSLPHAAVSDVLVAGCRVAAGTVVFANFYSTGWDPEVWGDPATFRPERFLTPDGSQVDSEVVNQFMCFGVGRRRCPGALFAKLEMFIFFVVLMQRCEFHAPPGRELSTDGNLRLTNRAKSYEVHVKAAANVDDALN